MSSSPFRSSFRLFRRAQAIPRARQGPRDSSAGSLAFERLAAIAPRSGAELLLARPRPSVLAELAVEVAVWRRVQQTNTGRIPLDAFRVTLSGLAPVSWLPRVHAGPPILRIRGQVAPGQLRQKVSVSSPYACDLPLLVQAREARRGWGVSSAVSPGNVLRARRRDTRDHRVVPSRLAQGRPTSGVVGDRSYSLAREPASSFIKYGTDAQP
jgi:hypothetical protein